MTTTIRWFVWMMLALFLLPASAAAEFRTIALTVRGMD